MDTVFQTTIKLVYEVCCTCGIGFGIESNHHAMLKREKKTFYCPNGHSQHYTAKTEAEKLREELEVQKQRTQFWMDNSTRNAKTIHSLEYSNRALKAAKTKIMNRVKRGVCPCCNRTFTNLQEHFKTVHPEIVNGNDN